MLEWIYKVGFELLKGSSIGVRRREGKNGKLGEVFDVGLGALCICQQITGVAHPILTERPETFVPLVRGLEGLARLPSVVLYLIVLRFESMSPEG